MNIYSFTSILPLMYLRSSSAKPYLSNSCSSISARDFDQSINEKITVKAVTEAAGINRNTFYLHYNYVDDVLAEIQENGMKVFRNKSLLSYKPFILFRNSIIRNKTFDCHVKVVFFAKAGNGFHHWTCVVQIYCFLIFPGVD